MFFIINEKEEKKIEIEFYFNIHVIREYWVETELQFKKELIYYALELKL